MSISNALHHDGVSKASPSHAPVKNDLALPPPPPVLPPPSKRVLWTEEEHRLFLQGVKQYGKGNWKKISENFVKSKTPVQVASHAQKYFIRQSSKVKKRKSIHDETLEIVQPSLNLNMNFRKQCQPDLPSHRHLNLNLNHPHIMPMPMPMQQDSTHHDRDQNRSVKNWWQQDSTHDNVNENHSVPRPLQQVPAHHIRDISHPSKHQNQHNRNIYPPPNHSYIDMIIQKSDEGHLDIFVRDSNQVKVKSVLTLQGSPHHLDLSSQQIHIPYFCSQNLPPQQCRVMLKNIATQP